MALVHSTQSDVDFQAPDFDLLGTEGIRYSLASFASTKGLLVVFLCNHCPYVIAIHERLSKLALEFAEQGIAFVGINSNDPSVKTADSFENMVITARNWNLPFPYLFDESQVVARAYDAVCTPDPYLFANVDGKFHLHYRGRIDDSWQDEARVKEQSLRLAMVALLAKTPRVEKQIPSMGCSIKWKNN